MSVSVNRVTLVGYLGRAPELRMTQKGTAVARFSLATNERWVDEAGERQERTQWHRIVVWGRTAEVCSQFLTKGRQVYVEGAIRSHTYTDADGQPRGVVEVVAERVVFLGSGAGEDRAASSLPGEDNIPF